jgi:inorganic pyrophosphatase
MNYIDIPSGDHAPEALNVVVEIPKGCINKYVYDVDLNTFRLDGILYSLAHYPGDYGFVPSTLADDGRPLDALVMADIPSFPGCVVEARPIGMFVMIDHRVEDHKLICVPTHDPRSESIVSYRNIHPEHLLKIEHFFFVYQEMAGKPRVTRGWLGVPQTRQAIISAIERYKRTSEQARLLSGNGYRSGV